MSDKDNVVNPEASDVPIAANSEAASPEGASAATTAAEIDPVEALTRQLEDQKADYLRLVAEFDNYRKRTTREFATVVKSANENLIGEMLEVLDNFERAFKSREEKPDFEAYHKGMTLLFEKLSGILQRAGLEKFESVGQRFDPHLHDALMQVESDGEPDTVVFEYEPGYRLHDKVIRHARVGVVKPKNGSGSETK